MVFLVAGKYLRQKRIDFQLPYDILWQWKHNQVGEAPGQVHHTLPLGRGRGAGRGGRRSLCFLVMLSFAKVQRSVPVKVRDWKNEFASIFNVTYLPLLILQNSSELRPPSAAFRCDSGLLFW